MIDFKNAEFFKMKPVGDHTFDYMLSPLMTKGEEVLATFKSIRDGVVFTNKRVITINVQGISGKKVDYTSLPYSKIQAYSVETAGSFDLDCELELWFSGLGKVKFEFLKTSNILDICHLISEKVL